MKDLYKNFNGTENSDLDLDKIQDFVNMEGMTGNLVANENLRDSAFQNQSGISGAPNSPFGSGGLGSVTFIPDIDYSSNLPSGFATEAQQGASTSPLTIADLPSLSAGSTSSSGSATAELCKKRSYRKAYPALCGMVRNQSSGGGFGQALASFTQGLGKGLGILNRQGEGQQAGGGPSGETASTADVVQKCTLHGFPRCESSGTRASCTTACQRKGTPDWLIPTLVGLIGIGVIVVAVGGAKKKQGTIVVPPVKSVGQTS